jgi:NAD(P)-dependent dehydrogenase (short-subunit alcohol dehydrogenase family)
VSFDLQGRVVAVAGAGGGGIGTAAVAAAVAAGASVVGFDTSAAGREVASAAGASLVLDVDATSRAAVEDALVGEVEPRLGPVDGLVNVVGGMRAHHWARLVDVDDDAIDELLATNLRAPLATSQAVTRRLLHHGRSGAIVHVSSVAGLVGMPFGGLYGAAKAAMANLTRTMAVEWGPAGIRVNAVAPGTIVTPKPERERFDDPAMAVDDDALTRVPLRRRGTPADVAGPVTFLLSDLAAYVTGQVLVVDGGMLARPPFNDADDLPVFVRDPALRARLV